MLQWTGEWCKHFYTILISGFLDKYPEVGFLVYIIVLFVIFWGISIVFRRSCTILQSHQQCARVPVASDPHQHLLFSGVFVFVLYNAHPNMYEVTSYCGFHWHLVIGDVEHLFMYLLVICMSFLEKYLFESLVCFFQWVIWFFFFPLCCSNSLYILDISPLSDTWFADIFSPFHRMPFYSVDSLLIFNTCSCPYFFHKYICNTHIYNISLWDCIVCIFSWFTFELFPVFCNYLYSDMYFLLFLCQFL